MGQEGLADSGWLHRFQGRERRALAEVLTLVEGNEAPPLPANTDSSPLVVGITGSGGAGKSTLVGALIDFLRSRGQTVAVLACDPASPKSGGALLGDRIRTRIDPADEGVYFRSLSTRGAQGGISAAVGAAIPWLARFGFDVVIIETVGAGQDQVAVRDHVERLVLVVTPGTGDEIQWEKAGILELADLVVVNKADLPGADEVQRQLQRALMPLASHSQRRVPVLQTTATTGQGVPELWQAIGDSPSP